MPSTTTKMGRVSRPQEFFATDEIQGDTKPKSNVLVYVLIVVAGAALILYLRSRAGGARTGPLVVLTSSAAPDQSTIDNLTNSVNALDGVMHPGAFTPPNVSGG